jgi:SIR2-like domain
MPDEIKPVSEYDQDWASFINVIKDRELAIILGAGLSYDSGIPTWQELTDKLIEAAEIDHACANNLSLSLPAKISLAQETYLARTRAKPWPELVRDILYKTFSERLSTEGINERLDGEKFVGYINRTNPTLAAVVNLCAVQTPNADGHYKKNDRIACLLTYNIDYLVQIYDRAKHGRPRILRTVERASASRERDKINIYHLHGYLRKYRRRPGVDTPDKLVLTEAEYNRRTDDPYSFANASLLWAMREFNCIFIGCSMTDELMRRSLHRSFEEITVALQSEGKVLNEAKKLARRHYAIIKEEHDENSKALRKLDLSLLGVNTLWVKEWAEIPDRLQALSIP